MGARRWLLVAISLLSLVMLASSGVGLAYSVPTGPAGERAIVLPLAGASSVTTGGQGAILAIGDAGGSFPSSATNVTLERALAYAPANASSTVNVTDVPMPNGTTNMSLDLGALSGGREGFVVKADDETAPRFVPTSTVIGQFVGPTTSSSLILVFVGSLLGFLAPLIALIVTHKGAAGAASANDIICRECRAPMEPGADFCSRCGAWKSGKEVAP